MGNFKLKILTYKQYLYFIFLSRNIIKDSLAFQLLAAPQKTIPIKYKIQSR